MTFIADESVDRDIVQRLRREGHQVWYVAEMDPGISDDDVLELANRETALLLTADKDFGEMVFRQRRFSGGIVLTRLAGLSAQLQIDLISTRSRQQWWGNVPAHVLPPVLFLVWAVAYAIALI